MENVFQDTWLSICMPLPALVCLLDTVTISGSFLCNQHTINRVWALYFKYSTLESWGWIINPQSLFKDMLCQPVKSVQFLLTTIEWPLIDVILVSNRFTCLTPLYLPWNISFCQMWASSLVSSQAYPKVSLFYTQIPMKSRRGDLTNMKAYI